MDVIVLFIPLLHLTIITAKMGYHQEISVVKAIGLDINDKKTIPEQIQVILDRKYDDDETQLDDLAEVGKKIYGLSECYIDWDTRIIYMYDALDTIFQEKAGNGVTLFNTIPDLNNYALSESEKNMGIQILLKGYFD